MKASVGASYGAGGNRERVKPTPKWKIMKTLKKVDPPEIAVQETSTGLAQSYETGTFPIIMD